MRILLATSVYPQVVKGPATYIRDLCKHFNDTHEITVVAYTNLLESLPGTKLIAINRRRPIPIRLAKYFLALWKEASKNDILYAQNAMAAGLPAALVSVLKGIPLVIRFISDEAWERAFHNHETKKELSEFLKKPEGSLKVKLMFLIQRWVLNRADAVTMPSDYIRKEIIGGYKMHADRVTTNYSPLGDEILLPFAFKPERHNIVNITDQRAKDNTREVLIAFSDLKKELPNVKLSVLGDRSDHEELIKFREELKLTDSIEFTGKISRAEFWFRLKNAKLAINNATTNSWPYSILDSLRAGTPVIASETVPAKEILSNKDMGLVVEKNSPEKLRLAMKNLLTDENLANKFSTNGLSFMKDQFSWKEHLKNLESVFKKIKLH